MINADEKKNDSPRVIVVGNGPSVLRHQAGELIDAFDRVVRINGFETEGVERHTGRKTTDWACSVVAPQRDAAAFRRMYLCGPTREWYDACTDLCHRVYPDAILLGPEITAQIKPYARGWPSTGLMIVAHLLGEHEQVTVHGFDGLKPEEQEHYFEAGLAGGSAHDPASELGYIQRMVESGRVRRLVLPPTNAVSHDLIPEQALLQRREACNACPQARQVDATQVRCRMAGSRPIDLASGRCRLSKWERVSIAIPALGEERGFVYHREPQEGFVERFRELGVMVIRNFASEGWVDQVRSRLHALFLREGIDPAQPHHLIGAHVKNPEFWPLIFDPKLVGVLHALAGGKVCFIEEEQVATGPFPSNWHRDNGYTRDGKWTDRQLVDSGYLRLRVLRYFSEPGHPTNTASFKLGTHRVGDGPETCIEVGPTDVVLFNANLLHRGQSPKPGGSKYLLTSTYSNTGSIAKEIYRYNSALRYREEYYNMTDDLLHELSQHNLAPLTLEEKHRLDRQVGVCVD